MAVMKKIRSSHSNAVVSFSKRQEEAKARLSQDAGQRSTGQDIMDQDELQVQGIIWNSAFSFVFLYLDRYAVYIE